MQPVDESSADVFAAYHRRGSKRGAVAAVVVATVIVVGAWVGVFVFIADSNAA